MKPPAARVVPASHVSSKSTEPCRNPPQQPQPPAPSAEELLSSIQEATLPSPLRLGVQKPFPAPLLPHVFCWPAGSRQSTVGLISLQNIHFPQVDD